MAQAADGVIAFRRKTGKGHDEEWRALQRELLETKTSLKQAYGGFNTFSDPDLVEFYVYEINALQARYAYLLRRIKTIDRQKAGA
ncbi:MAG: YaaL family protein [Oscillospiraceae bacterium]|nr:YaaL family protein [Oscillospiraceae bacterium]